MYKRSGGNSIDSVGNQKQCFMVKVVILNKYSKASFGYSWINIRITDLCRNKRVFNRILPMMVMVVIMMMIVLMCAILRDFHLHAGDIMS